jgi:hypothetical protein
VLVAAQPTRGVDVGSIEYIHRQLVAKRDAGVGVLLVSSELDEVIALADRVAVMFRGRLVGPFPTPVAKEALGLMMAGVDPDEALRRACRMSAAVGCAPDATRDVAAPERRGSRSGSSLRITGADVRLTVLAFVAAFAVGALFLALSDARTLDARWRCRGRCRAAGGRARDRPRLRCAAAGVARESGSALRDARRRDGAHPHRVSR